MESTDSVISFESLEADNKRHFDDISGQNRTGKEKSILIGSVKDMSTLSKNVEETKTSPTDSAMEALSKIEQTQLEDEEQGIRGEKKTQIKEATVEENVFKGITEDISNLSADFHQKMTFASTYIGKMLLDSTAEDTDDKKERKETFLNTAFNTVGKVASNVTKEMGDVAVNVSRDMDQVAKELGDAAKTVTKEIGNVSSSVTSSVTSAMEGMERVTVNLRRGVKESFVDAFQPSEIEDEKKDRKMKGELLWSDSKHEKQVKDKILALSQEKTNFTEAPWILLDPLKGGDFDFDYELFAPTALVMLGEDPRLNELRYHLVPKMVQEEQFWRNYFYRIQIIKQQFIDNPESEDDQEKGEQVN